MEKVQTTAEAVSRAVEALGQQALLHVELLKAEMAQEGSALGKALAPMLIGLPLIGVAYGFGCVALALALVPWIGGAGGAAVVGLLNLILGGGAVRLCLKRLERRRSEASRPAIQDGAIQDGALQYGSEPIHVE